MSSRVIASGHWEDTGAVTMTVSSPPPPAANATSWHIGQIVEVQPRTWAGINRPGGHGRITKIHYFPSGGVEGLDVKYTVHGGRDNLLDPDLVKPHEDLHRAGRNRKLRKLFCPPSPTQRLRRTARSLTSKESSKQPKAKNSLKNMCKPRKKRTKKANNNQLDRENLPPDLPCEVVIPTSPQMQVTPLLENGVECHPPRQYMLSQGDDPPPLLDADHSLCSCSELDCEVDDGAPNARTKTLGSGHMSPSDPSPHVVAPISRPNKEDQQQQRVVVSPKKRLQCTLREVFEQKKQSASNFVNGLVGNNNEKLSEAPCETEKSEDDLVTPEEEPKQLLKDEKQDNFVAMLNGLLLDNDGTIEEGELLTKVNQTSSTQAYSASDLDGYLKTLYDEDKVMRSDGYVYSI